MCPPAQIQREDLFGDKEIRCLLVHDHVLLRQGLRRLLEDEPDMEVVAEAGDAAEALRKVFEFRPEIVITDAHIFECAADQAERLILLESPYSKVLFLSMHEGDDVLPETRTDPTSCVVRHTSAEELVEMVRRTHAAQRMEMGCAGKTRGRMAVRGTASAKARADGARARSVEVAGRGQDGALGGRRSWAQHEDGGCPQVQSDAQAGDP